MNLTLAKAPRQKLTITARDNDAVILLSTFDPLSEKSRNSIAQKLGIDPAAFLQFVSKGEGDYEYGTTAESSAPQYHFTYHTESGVSEQHSGDLALLETLVQRDTGYVRWGDTHELAILDGDWHGVTPPNPERLRFILSQMTPQPVFWWRSRGGGFHAVYVRRNQLAADVLAAAAGFSLMILDDTSTFEVLSNTRVAGSSELHRPIATEDLSSLRTFLSGGVSPAEVDDWLEAKGLEKNKSYPHTACPVASYSESKGEPVWVGENYITCHRCRALGIRFGSHTPGLFPFAVLCGSRRLNEVATMVQNFTHYTHAEVVLESRCRLRGNTARLAYEGMLRMWHGEEESERIDKVFSVGRSVIRGVGRWVTPGRNETLKDLRNTLKGFPAVSNNERLDMFMQTMDLCDYGYSSIRPLHGMRVFGEFLGQENGPVTNMVLRTDDPQLTPRYVAPAQRLPIEEAWERVEKVFPGINRRYVELLIAARGVSEGEIGLPPNIVVLGPSSSGKTVTIHVAASLLGDRCGEVPWNANVERFRQGYQEMSEAGSFVAINEVVKDATRARITPRAAFDYFLNLTPDSVSHKMYIGPVALGRIPVTVVTETFIPGEVRADIQLARRFIYVRLDSRIDWVQSLIDSGVRQASNFRNFSVDNAEAANAIVSDIIDRFFRTEPQNLAQIARRLGFDTLEECDEPLDDPTALSEFFNAVCKAPDAEDHALTGRGWKKVKQDDETELASAWKSVCDGEHSIFAFCSSRRCSEVDWSTVVSIPIGTRLQISRRGKYAAFRFVYGETRGRGLYYVNEELLTCSGERRVSK